jgi:hypothetical protein
MQTTAEVGVSRDGDIITIQFLPELGGTLFVRMTPEHASLLRDALTKLT